MSCKPSLCLFLLDESVDPNHPGVLAMAAILGPVNVMFLDEFQPDIECDRIVICAFPDSGRTLMHFVLKNLPVFSNHVVGLINLGNEVTDPGWIPDVVALLGCSGQNSAVIPLDQTIEPFLNYALAFNTDHHKPSSDMPRRKLKQHIEEFLNDNSSLILSNAYQNRLFSTTLRYCYADGHLYCSSPGGEFLSGVIQNHKVSLVIQNSSTSSHFHASGNARLISRQNEAFLQYMNALALVDGEGFKGDHLIDIRLQEADFSSKELSDQGLQIPQIFHF